MDSFGNPLANFPGAEPLRPEQGQGFGQQKQEDVPDRQTMNSFAKPLQEFPNAKSLLREQVQGIGQRNQEDMPDRRTMDAFANPLQEFPNAKSLLREQDHGFGQQNQEGVPDRTMSDAFANPLQNFPYAKSLLREQVHGLGQQNQEDMPDRRTMDAFANPLQNFPYAKSLLREQVHGLGQQHQADKSDRAMNSVVNSSLDHGSGERNQADVPDRAMTSVVNSLADFRDTEPLYKAEYSVVNSAIVDQCDQCGKTFRKPGALQTHIDAQHKGIRYPCKICGRKLKYKGNLSAHMEQMHNIKTDYNPQKRAIKRTCVKCKVTFSSMQLMYKHLREVHNESKPVSCSACSEKLTDLYSYATHKYKHAHLVPYRCDVCRLRYAAKWGLRVHIETSEHRQKSADWSRHTEFDELDNVCYICNEKLDRHLNLQRHLGEHSKTKNGCPTISGKKECHICKEPVTKNHLESHLMIQHGIITPPDAEKVPKDVKPTFKCKECDKTYKSEAFFRFHMKIHSGEPKIQCDQCEYATYVPADMKKHKRSVHAGERPYKCPTCNKAFADQSRRKQCMVRHTAIKTILCRLCKEAFPHRNARRIHEERMCPMRGNDDTVPVYECKVCNKSYMNKPSLGVHMKNHKGEPEKCEECNFKTFCTTDMRKHKLEHAGGLYKCPVCSRTYRDSQKLHCHMRCHSGVTEKCEECNFETDWRAEMQKHKGEHAGRLYKCPACSKSYLNRHNFDRHLKRHHPKTQSNNGKRLRSSNPKEAEHKRCKKTRSEGNVKKTKACAVKAKEAEVASSSGKIEAGEQNDKACVLWGKEATEVIKMVKPAEQDRETAIHSKASVVWGKAATEVIKMVKPAEQDRETAIHSKDARTDCGSLKLEVEDCSGVPEIDYLTNGDEQVSVSFNMLNGDLNMLPVSQLKALCAHLENNLDRVKKVLHTKESESAQSMITSPFQPVAMPTHDGPHLISENGTSSISITSVPCSVLLQKIEINMDDPCQFQFDL